MLDSLDSLNIPKHPDQKWSMNKRPMLGELSRLGR